MIARTQGCGGLWSRAAAGMLFFGSLLGCGPDTQQGWEERPTGIPERRVVSETWDTVFALGGAADTLLQLPGRLASAGGGLYVLDAQAGRLLRLDAEGRLLWTYGQPGSGPDEFRMARELQVDSLGRAWVLDPVNARITVVGADGRAVLRVPLDRSGVSADDFVPLGTTEAMLLTGEPRESLVRVDTTGTVLARLSIPLAGFEALHPLARQLVVASRPGAERWAAALQVADGFLLFDREGRLAHRGWFPEPVPPPTVAEERSGASVTSRLARPTFGAWAVTLSPTHLYVLFGGRTPQRMRLLDSYRLADGSYDRTWLLPVAAEAIDWSDGTLHVVAADPWPRVLALRPPNGLP